MSKALTIVTGKGKSKRRAVVPRGRAYRVMRGNRVLLQGHGNYWDDIVDNARSVGKGIVQYGLPMAGAGLGGYFGPMGAAAGAGLGGAAAHILGAGKYRGKVTGGPITGSGWYGAPSIRMMPPMLMGNHVLTGGGAYGHRTSSGNTMLASPVPAMHSSDESVRLHRVEYITDVFASSTAGAFSVTSFALNPGMLLPWGSTIAALFEQYKIKGMAFMFKTRSTNYSTSTTLGSLIMATNYNVNADAYVTKQQMEAASGATTSTIDQDCMHYIECKSRSTAEEIMYVRTGTVSVNGTNIADLHSYDLGNFQIATSGCAASVNIGELWCSYDLELLKPMSVFGTTIDSAHYTLTSPATADPFGTVQTRKFDFIGVTFPTAATHYTGVSFPLGSSGTYRIKLVYWGCTASTNTTAFSYTLTNCTAVNLYNNSSAAVMEVPPANTANTTLMTVETVVNITSPSAIATVVVAAGTVCTSPTQSDLFIEQLNTNEKN